MGQVIDFLTNLFGMESWPPRWHCGIWSDFHGWLYIGSDFLIWAAYFTIPFFLFKIMQQRPGFPFPRIFWWFAAFILFCGLTHLLDAVIFWFPMYRLSALVRFMTAIVSWITIWEIIKILPEVKKIKTYSDFKHELEERHKIEDELKGLVNVTSEQNKRLINFAHIVSHNLKSHASNFKMLIEIYKSEDSKESREGTINLLEVASHQLQDTVSNLIDVVELTTDITQKEQDINLYEVVEKERKNIEGLLISNQAVCINEVDKNITVKAVPAYLESILLNLMTNSIKYSSPKRIPTILFRTERKNNRIVLYVEDNGLGIDLKKHGKKIFGMYQKFHGNVDARGIGLFITKNQVESMGGTIDVESELGEGTTFIITFRDFDKDTP